MQASRRRGDVSLLGASRFRGRVRLAPRSHQVGAGQVERVSKEHHLVIDQVKCDGRGICAELLPELIRLDDWDYPILAPGPIPDHLIPLAKRAVDDCPVLELALRSS